MTKGTEHLNQNPNRKAGIYCRAIYTLQTLKNQYQEARVNELILKQDINKLVEIPKM